MRSSPASWRARPLEAPPGHATRPTGDRVRETLFSMLASRLGSFEDLRIADLYAGSGALGLEALSRGAASATFVENDAQAVATIRRNAGKLGARTAWALARVGACPSTADPFDLVFADPPYAWAPARAVEAVDPRRRLAGPRRLDERRDKTRRRGRSGVFRAHGRRAMWARAGFRFCAALSGLPDLFELIAEPPADRRRGGLAGFLDRLAGALAAASLPPLANPCSASEASAAVAATATSSATNGLCMSLISASPIRPASRRQCWRA